MPDPDTAPLPPLTEERDLLADAVRHAGREVLRMREEDEIERFEKDDGTPVTSADYAANDILKERFLTGIRAAYGWLSEENADDRQRLEARRTFVVDPIDGTRSFMERRDDWTVCAALVEGEEVVAAAIYNPETDELFSAARGEGCLLNGEPARHSGRPGLEGATILATRRAASGKGHSRLAWPDVTLTYRCSTSYRLALVANGAVDGLAVLGPKADWDVAPGALIAAEAGARITDHTGKALTFGHETPMQRSLVCAAPEVYREMMERLG